MANLLRTDAVSGNPPGLAPPPRLTVVRDRDDRSAASARPAVVVVDDHEAIRDCVCELLESVGIPATALPSAADLLASEHLDSPGCLIVDVRMPGMGGLALQELLIARGNTKPIVFLTGHADVEMSVQAMKAGAIDFLTKPVREQTLLDAVALALGVDAARRAEAVASRRSADLFAALTERERQVMRAVVQGELNKRIAYDLGISEVTVKLHRSNMMRKMNVRSVAGLVQAWQALPADLRAASAARPQAPAGGERLAAIA